MDAEGYILALMVAGVPASVAFFTWFALRSGHDCTSLRPVWIVLLKGRQDEDGGQDDDGWPPGRPPSSPATSSPTRRGPACPGRRLRGHPRGAVLGGAGLRVRHRGAGVGRGGSLGMRKRSLDTRREQR